MQTRNALSRTVSPSRDLVRQQRAAACQGDSRWRAVLGRDHAADGSFVYSVSTTGVYCRPSCPSRLPRPEHVRFHATPAAAAGAGFRACLRCRPVGLPAEAARHRVVERVCRLIEGSGPIPALGELAAACALSPSHLHRLFKAATGLTPKGYAEAHRRTRVTDALGGPEPVTMAAYSAGFASSSGFYRTAGATLGMTPTQYRRGGADTAIGFALGSCSLGAVLVAASARGVCAVLLGDSGAALGRELAQRFPSAVIQADPALAAVLTQVVAVIEDPRRGIAPGLALDIRGTAFQQRVWQELRRIASGRTLSYGALAARIGSPRAVRAVASACAANALAVIIPCHRVVAQSGGLSGYRWGVARKRALIEREARARKG
jgi:AraC family transcriptional regulator, regulatory protein of adaptative response / methylated-DNA-[protein]-cysteine methyltransferase